MGRIGAALDTLWTLSAIFWSNLTAPASRSLSKRSGHELTRALVDAETNDIVNGSGTAPHLTGS